MKLEAGCGVATSEVPKSKKEAEPDGEPLSENLPQEARFGSGFETEDKPLGAESGPKAKPRSGSGPETEVEWLDFMGATAQEFEQVLAISGSSCGGLNYLPNPYHSWLWDPNCTMVLAKWNREVVRTWAPVKRGKATFGCLDLRKERKQASPSALVWLLRI